MTRTRKLALAAAGAAVLLAVLAAWPTASPPPTATPSATPTATATPARTAVYVEIGYDGGRWLPYACDAYWTQDENGSHLWVYFHVPGQNCIPNPAPSLLTCFPSDPEHYPDDPDQGAYWVQPGQNCIPGDHSGPRLTPAETTYPFPSTWPDDTYVIRPDPTFPPICRNQLTEAEASAYLAAGWQLTDSTGCPAPPQDVHVEYP